MPLPLTGAGDDRIRDLGWRTPGSLAVLSAPTVGTSQVLIVKIDGSSTPEDLSTDAELFRDQAVRLVTAPSAGSPLYIRTGAGQLFSLAANGRWTGTSIEPGLGLTHLRRLRPSASASSGHAERVAEARRRCCRRSCRSSPCRRPAPGGPSPRLLTEEPGGAAGHRLGARARAPRLTA